MKKRIIKTCSRETGLFIHIQKGLPIQGNYDITLVVGYWATSTPLILETTYQGGTQSEAAMNDLLWLHLPLNNSLASIIMLH